MWKSYYRADINQFIQIYLLHARLRCDALICILCHVLVQVCLQFRDLTRYLVFLFERSSETDEGVFFNGIDVFIFCLDA